MAGDSKFIQITSTSTTREAGRAITELFALDQDGNVWLYDSRALEEPVWVPLAMTRRK